MSRPPVLEESQLSPEQQVIFDDIRSGPRGVVEGPLRVWLHSAALAEPAQKLGAFCRYGTKLPPRLSELGIITVGAHWKSGFEWHVHAPIAATVGIDADAIAAIKAGRKPDLSQEDEIVIYDFTRELLTTHHVSNVTYELAINLFGLQAIVELVGILGYYTFICMTINAFRVPVPSGSPEPFV
jgi:4-carboxymuconolactone decarboxylase